MSKDYNRNQEEKAFKKAKKIVEGWEVEDIDNAAHKLKSNRKKCSCAMCRNPRTSKLTKGKGKFTIQERKANED